MVDMGWYNRINNLVYYEPLLKTEGFTITRAEGGTWFWSTRDNGQSSVRKVQPGGSSGALERFFWSCLP